MGYENNYYQQQPRLNSYPYQNSMVSSGLKGRPVSSIDEARAMQIDFDGSLFIFPDIANKRIYTKQIGMDGTAILNMYELKPIPSLANGDYITREEFENAVASIKAAISKTEDKSISLPKTDSTPAAKQEYNF